MMWFKAIVLVSAIVCFISAEKMTLKKRIFNCKSIPFKKHHSIFESIIPSIVVSPVDSAAVPGEYNVPAEVTTLGTDPAPVPTVVPVESQQEEQNPPPQEVQYPPQPEVQYPPQPEVQYPPQPEVQYPVPQQEVQPPAAPQQEVQNTPEQRPLYPPQHEGQKYYVEQNPSLSNDRPYYLSQSEGLYYPPPNYQGFTTNNVPYNYPVYGQNVLRSVKSFDDQTYPLHQRPYRVNMLNRKPVQYYYVPRVYDQYYAPQYNYVSQAPRTAQALTGGKAKST